MRQKVVPLDHTIERFGGGAPPGDNRFHIDAVVSNDMALSSLPLEDDFAPGQFEALTEDEKLTRRAFERMQSGVRVQSDRTLISAHVVRNLDYETVYVDNARSRRVVRGMGIARTLGLATLARSAARRSPMANRGPSRFGSRRGHADGRAASRALRDRRRRWARRAGHTRYGAYRRYPSAGQKGPGCLH